MRQFLLEYSDIIRDLRPYPNGAKLATFAYADKSLSNRPLHDANPNWNAKKSVNDLAREFPTAWSSTTDPEKLDAYR